MVSHTKEMKTVEFCYSHNIATNPDFLPSTMDSGFNKWAIKGLTYIAQVFHRHNMKSFEQL